MPERFKENVGVVLRELRPNAIWDAIKLIGLGVLAILGLAVTAILQRMRGVSPDVLGIIILGIAWLVIVFAAYAFGKFRRARASREVKVPLSEPRVEVLMPCDRWYVGSRIMIRGSVFPQGSSVQLLIRPWNEAWYLHKAEVRGCAWTFNYYLKEHTRYEIVAIYGNALKKPQYDEIPLNAVKSEVISIMQDPNQSDLIDCFDKQLHRTKIEDKNQLDALVIVCGVRYQEHQEGNGPAHIEFVISILNMSLFPVSVESVDGHITYFIDAAFYSAKLPPTLELKQNASNLGFRQSGWFKVQQDFKTEGEANHLLNAPPNTTLFQFNSLNIRVAGEDCAFTLNTSAVSFMKRDKQWLQRDEIDFVLAMGAKEQRRMLEAGDAALREITRVDRS